MMHQILDKVVKPIYHATFRPVVWKIQGYKWLMYAKKYIPKCKQRIAEKCRNNKRIRVLFIMQYPEMWGSERTVYETMKQDSRFHVDLLAMPKRIGVNSKIASFQDENEALGYCKSNDISAINAYENGTWFDIRSLEPDYIFLQRPYDEFMPKPYQMKTLMQYALLCYIPYSGHLTKGVHIKIEFCANMLRYIYIVFADSAHTAEYVRNNSIEMQKAKLRKVCELGFPRFDLIQQECNDNLQSIDTVMWTPRWSTNDENDKSYFSEYYETIMSYFENHREANLVIRPHPLMFTNFIEKGVMTEQEVEQIKQRVETEPNIRFDQNFDYNITFRESTIMLSDITSLLLEYFITGKPIIFCGKIRDFTQEGVEMAKQYYHVKNAKQLTNRLDQLLAHSCQYLPE